MNDLAKLTADHEPAVETIELLCDQLADLGLAVAPQTARDLIRTVLAAEAPRLDARWRGAFGASLDTIRIAAQAALGMLKTSAGPEPAPRVRAAAPRPTPAKTAPAIAHPPAQARPPAPAQAPAVVPPTASVPPTAAPSAPPAPPPPAPPARSAARTSGQTPLPASRRPIARRGPRRPSGEAPLPPPPATDRRTNPPDIDDDSGEPRPVFRRPRR